MYFDAVVIGSGLTGCTIAERIANVCGRKVLVIEKRDHIGGNAYDYYDDNGILVQKYGPHGFHTNSDKVFNYLSKFTGWNSFAHRVFADVNGKIVPLPVGIPTLEQLYGRKFTPSSMRSFLDKRKVNVEAIHSSRDYIVSHVGEELYELLFKYYSKKQWGVFPDKLDASVAMRLPIRFNRDTRYHESRFQGNPRHGFFRMTGNMLRGKNISLLLNTDYKDIIKSLRYRCLIFTGPIDYFFDYKFGKLPYRSLDFRFKTFNREWFQPYPQVNFTLTRKYTRISEYKHFYFQKHDKTTVCYEYPKAYGEPYYPILTQENIEKHDRYRKLKKRKNIFFIGRLAEYKYLNMDQVVENALTLFRTRLKKELL